MDCKEFVDQWVKNLMESMDAHLDEEARVALMEACGRACARTGPALVAADCRGDLDQWLAILAGWHGGEECVRRDGDAVEVLCAECLCNLVKDGPAELSATYCSCSLGWMKETFEAVLGWPIDATLVESVKRGGQRCRFKIQLCEVNTRAGCRTQPCSRGRRACRELCERPQAGAVTVGRLQRTKGERGTEVKEKRKYTIELDTRFGFQELIDVPGLIAACEEPWYNQTLCQVNDCVVRLGVMQGEFHWHKHDEEDEFFFVLQGSFLVDLESETIILEPHQGYAVPRGVMHRTRAPERSAILMVEGSGVRPTGD